jgi:hypothetical protein
MNKSSHTFATFLQLLRRDIYVAFKQFSILGINYGFIYPFMYALCFLYVEPRVLFEQHMTLQNGSITFIGQISLFALILSFHATINVLFDLVGDRFIDYQCTLLNARAVLIERLVFAALFSFFLLLPFFPVAKMLFPDAFLIPHASWLSLSWILLLTAFMTSAYHLMAACLMRGPHQISRLWIRCNEIMLTIGGLLVPWHVIYETSHVLGYLALLNPLVYVSEGARQALLTGPEFFPLWISSTVMIIVTIVCTIVACRVFKKRIDHI